MIPRTICALLLAAPLVAVEAVPPVAVPTETAPPIAPVIVQEGPAQPAPATPNARPPAIFGVTGLRFGGIIGGAVETTLAWPGDGPLGPELGASVGVSGTKFTLGARYPLGERHWVLGRGQGPIAIRTSTALTPRLVACYRWEDEEREPDFWRGIAGADGWYCGGEVGITWYGLALDVAVTWNTDHGGGPHATLGYGLAF